MFKQTLGAGCLVKVEEGHVTQPTTAPALLVRQLTGECTADTGATTPSSNATPL